MKSYELDLQEDPIRKGKKEYITQTHRKYFKYALNWCLENNWNSCKVNRTYYNFDFDKMEVSISSIGYNNYITYKIKEI